MQKLIISGDELKLWFFNVISSYQGIEKIESGINVDTSVRREVLTDVGQGKIILNGRVLKIKFHNIGGGVYRAYVEYNC